MTTIEILNINSKLMKYFFILLLLNEKCKVFLLWLYLFYTIFPVKQMWGIPVINFLMHSDI